MLEQVGFEVAVQMLAAVAFNQKTDFTAVGRLGPDHPYLSPVAPRMTYAIPVYQPGDVEVRTHQLQELNRQLETASRHKSAFLASMSHELRTPLSAIDWGCSTT